MVPYDLRLLDARRNRWYPECQLLEAASNGSRLFPYDGISMTDGADEIGEGPLVQALLEVLGTRYEFVCRLGSSTVS